MKALFAGLACPAVLLAACSSPQEQARDQAEDELERSAERSADQSGDAVIALGMTERQLLEADIVSTTGMELGDVAAIVRGPNGQVEQLLVEIEDSDPDRFVHVPLDGLSSTPNTNDRDIVTSLTREQLAALPDALPSAGNAAQTTP